MKRFAFFALVLICLLPALQVQTRGADVLKGDEAKDAKKRLRDVKRAWKKADKASEYALLDELSHLPDKSVGHFVEDGIEDDGHRAGAS